MQHAAVFIGSRPPSELPLFTTDPFLPCPSRHFDIRESLHRTGNQASVASQATGSQAEDGQVGEMFVQSIEQERGTGCRPCFDVVHCEWHLCSL